MRVERFEAKTMRQALEKVKTSIGEDAVILTTRTLPAKGLFGKEKVEVTACTEDAHPDIRTGLDAVVDDTTPGAGKGDDALLQRWRGKQSPRPGRTSDSGGDTRHQADSAAHHDPPRRAGFALTDADWSAGDWPAAPRARPRGRPQNVAAEASDGSVAGASAKAEQLYDALLDSDVAPDLARTLTASSGGTGASATELQTQLETRVFRHRLPQQRVVAFVGPTGVGKTTTIAKVAATAALIEKRRVALINLDGHRVGAFSHLQEYASLIDIPCTSARSAAGFEHALGKLQQADLILVDTAGRHPADADALEQLARIFATHEVGVVLTIAAPTRRVEAERILERYAAVQPGSVTFTKLDEAAVFGGLVNVCARSGLPVSYLTTGQRVPEDLTEARADLLARNVATQIIAHARQSGSSEHRLQEVALS